MACKGLLWVGTNVGICLTVPLPRLEGVPIISGSVNISLHAHFGPVTFLQPLITRSYQKPPMPLQATPTKVPKRPDDKNNNIVETNNNHHNKSMEETSRPKMEKQHSLDVAGSSPKMRSLMPNSPIVLRRKSHVKETFEISRLSKTLPRGFSGVGFFNTSASIHSNSSSSSSQHGSEQGCDVYGLYSDLLFVKEDFDGVSSSGNHIMEQPYECLRRSDPDLAAIPAKVSTLDRRLKMKVGSLQIQIKIKIFKYIMVF